MRLTVLSDYALRLLMMADAAEGHLITIEQAAMRYRISRAHLMKVANALTRAGFLHAVRGRYGGLKLARPARDISLADVLRATEPDFSLVDCFGEASSCPIAGTCRLPRILKEALVSFLLTLDRYSLHDIRLNGHPFDLEQAS